MEVPVEVDRYDHKALVLKHKDDCLHTLRDHKLIRRLPVAPPQQIPDSAEGYAIYSLKRPNTLAYSLDLTFTPYSTIISGDWSPEHPVTSNVVRGRSLRWFTSHHRDWQCLAKNFLAKQWVPEAAEQFLKDELEELKRVLREEGVKEEDILENDDVETLDSILLNFLPGYLGQEEWEFAASCDSHEYDISDGHGLPGYVYDPFEVGHLWAIQMTFKSLLLEG